MKYILLLLAILMFSTTATAHEVKLPPMKEACAAAKWMKNTDRITFVGPNKFENYAEIYQLYEAAQDECEAYQEPKKNVDGSTCIDGDVTKVVTKCE